MKPLIIYHAGCLDGAAAALAAWLKFGDEAEYRPASYGDPAPTDEEVRGRDVYVLDFSYPRAELQRMFRAAMKADEKHTDGRGSLLVLDHHKSAQIDLADLPFCHFNMFKAGAALAWEHFGLCAFHGKSECWCVRRIGELFAYVQDRDLGRWELPHSREISAALAASEALTDFRKLIPIYRDWVASNGPLENPMRTLLRNEGAAILRAERLMVERIAATAEEVTLTYDRTGWIQGECGNVPWIEIHALAAYSAVLQSEVGEALALESARRGRDAVGVVYYRDGEDGKWHLSLRSRFIPDAPFEAGDYNEETQPGTPAPDVSAIAKSFGGDGHAKAAEFECDELPWTPKRSAR